MWGDGGGATAAVRPGCWRARLIEVGTAGGPGGFGAVGGYLPPAPSRGGDATTVQTKAGANRVAATVLIIIPN